MIKKCTRCLDNKDTKLFSKNIKCKDGVRSYCKQCQADYDKRRYANVADYYKNKSANWRSANTEKRAGYRTKWKKDNKEKVKEYNRQYRHLIKLAGDLNILEAVKSIVKGKEFICKICSKHGKCTVDHIIPVSKGGNNKISNLQILCALCNSIKSNKMPNVK